MGGKGKAGGRAGCNGDCDFIEGSDDVNKDNKNTDGALGASYGIYKAPTMVKTNKDGGVGVIKSHLESYPTHWAQKTTTAHDQLESDRLAYSPQ